MSERNLSDVGIDTVQNMVKGMTDVIRLESGDTDLPPMRRIIKATKDAIGKVEYNTYYPFNGLKVLRDAIAARIKQDDGLVYKADGEIVVTAGGTEGMLDALLATVGIGDEVLMPEPIYAGMINRVRLTGAIPVFVPLIEKNGWRLDLESMKEKITPKTKAVFFVSPNSPTGTVFSREELEAIAAVAKAHDLVIIYNAVFDKMVFNDKVQLNIAAFPHMRERTIVIGSVSKNYGMTGWRVGWVAGPEKYLRNVHQIHISNAALASPAAQIGAVEALEGPQDWVAERVVLFQKRHDALYNRLVEGMPLIKPVKAEGGWSFLVDVRELTASSYEFAEFLLKEAKVAVTPMKEWGDASGEGHVRFVFSKNEIPELEEAARRVLESISKFRA
jgi:N-succinyldiaminopimelate aminotransferase